MLALIKELFSDERKLVPTKELKVLNAKGMKSYQFDDLKPKNLKDFKSKTYYGRIKEDPGTGTNFMYKVWIMELYGKST